MAHQTREALHGVMLSLVGKARRCYGPAHEWEWKPGRRMDDAAFADMLLLDGCFLLQLMVFMFAHDSPWPDPLVAVPEVREHIDAITQDIFLLDNQIPWFVPDTLIELRPPCLSRGSSHSWHPPSTSALATARRPTWLMISPAAMTPMGSTRHISSASSIVVWWARRAPRAAASGASRHSPAPRWSSRRWASMGVKLTASKTKKFGDMAPAPRPLRRALPGAGGPHRDHPVLALAHGSVRGVPRSRAR